MIFFYTLFPCIDLRFIISWPFYLNSSLAIGCRLGFIIEFLSHAAIVGFMAGAAITIALQQLKGLLNITNFTTATDFISVMKSVFGNVDQVMEFQIHCLLAKFLLSFLDTKNTAAFLDT